jgi:MFS family permease
MSDLHVSKFAISTVTFAASLVYGVGALVGGPLGDKIGETRTIILCLAFSGLCTLIMLVAGATSSVYVFALALVAMAVFASLYHPTANSLISKAFKGSVGEAMGLHGVGGTLGVVLTPTVAWFIGAAFGWQWAFVAFGVLCVVLAVLFLRLPKNNKGGNSNGGTIIDVFKIRELWVLLVFNVMIGLFMKSVELFFPTYLTDNRSINAEWAAVAYTLLLAAGVPGQWIGGRTADRIGSRGVLIVTSAGISVGFLALLFIPVYLVGVAVFILLYGLFFYAHQPALNSLAGFLSPEKQRGAVYGVFFFTNFGVGALSQPLAGYLADVYGLDVTFYMLTTFALAALVLSFWLPRRREDRALQPLDVR